MRIATLLVMLLATASSHAATVGLGELAPGQLAGGSLLSSGNTVDDIWTFALTEEVETIVYVYLEVGEAGSPFTDLVATSPDFDFELTGGVLDGDDEGYFFEGLLPAGTYEVLVTGALLPPENLGDFQDREYFFVVAAVPLPLSVWLMGSALFGLLALGRRRAAV